MSKYLGKFKKMLTSEKLEKHRHMGYFSSTNPGQPIKIQIETEYVIQSRKMTSRGF